MLAPAFLLVLGATLGSAALPGFARAAELEKCTGFRAALNASDSPGPEVQECEKSSSDETARRTCLRRIHPDIERTVYEFRCETVCANASPDSDELMACQVIKANALKGRRTREGVPSAILAAAKERATSASAGKPPTQFWSRYVEELRAIEPPRAAAGPGIGTQGSGAACEALSKYVAIAKAPGCKAPTTRPVHLTFDDGPSLATTPKALEVLRRNGISGTFFVLGSLLDTRARKSGTPAHDTAIARLRLIREIRKQGSTIASHNYVHEAHTTLDQEKLAGIAQKSRDAGVGAMVDGVPMEPYLEPVYRLPYGDGQPVSPVAYKRTSDGGDSAAKADPILDAYTEQAGFRNALYWHVDTEDWRTAGKYDEGRISSMPAAEKAKVRLAQRNEVLTQLMKGLCRSGGGTVLFHDIHPSTVENLQAYIDAMACAGYSFDDLDSQFKGGITPWLDPDLRPSPVCAKSGSEPTLPRIGFPLGELEK